MTSIQVAAYIVFIVFKRSQDPNLNTNTVLSTVATKQYYLLPAAAHTLPPVSTV